MLFVLSPGSTRRFEAAPHRQRSQLGSSHEGRRRFGRVDADTRIGALVGLGTSLESSRCATSKHLLEHSGARMLDIAGGRENGDRLLPAELRRVDRQAADAGNRRSCTAIATSELLDLLDSVAVPATKIGTRRDVFEPLVECGVDLCHTPRPQVDGTR